MLAVLAAVTEVIKEQGGKESTTEYFAALVSYSVHYCSIVSIKCYNVKHTKI